MSDNTYARGRFVWRELITTDFDASKAFYGGLFGWTFEDHPMPTGEGVYPVINKGERALGGMISLQSIGKDGIPPCWMSYVSIADIDDAAAAAKANGGIVDKEPTTIPTVGRFSVIGDPQHAFSSIINFETGDPPPQDSPDVGTFCWEQLNTSDVDAAVDFYHEVFGWEKRIFEDAGNVVTMFAGKHPVASFMQAPEGVPPHWATYVAVKDLASSRERVKELGGQIMVETIAIPAVGTISVINDPQDAVLCLFQPPNPR